VSPQESTLLQAEDEDECKEWVDVLHNAIANSLNSQPVQAEDVSEETTEKPMDAIRAASPDNCFCVDCGAESK
jgi:hypothetical protein